LAFEDIETFYTNKGESKLALRAKVQLRLQNGDEVFPKGFFIDIYDEAGKRKTEIKADSGHFLSEHGLYLMIGDVKVSNFTQQQILETPILYWDERFREIYTDTVLKITTPKEIINGVGLRAKQDFSQYKIGRPTGVIRIEQSVAEQ
jgi:LPS export ABC transporter protein LptC